MTYDIYAFAYAALNLICWILWLSLLFWIFRIPETPKTQTQERKIPILNNNAVHNNF